jgi:hypothetical protein
MVVESDIIVDGATINGDVVDDSFGEETDGCGCSTAIREDSERMTTILLICLFYSFETI